MGELLVSLNWWAVITGSAAFFVLGSLWYSPALFAKPWMAEMKMEEHPESPNPVIFLYSFILQLIAVISLALFMQAIGISTAVQGFLIGAGAGLGFVFTLAGTTGIFNDSSLKLHFINNGYHVMGLALAGLILGAW